jgi:hypothetical protein
MPIREERLEKSFIGVDGRLTVDELRPRVSELPERPRYLVVSLPNGAYSASLLAEIPRAIDRLGPDALGLPLASLPGLAEPTAAVRREAMGQGEAERLRDRQPSRRLVVLEAERPIGLLTNEARGGSAAGLPFQLYNPFSPFTLSGDELRRILLERRDDRTCNTCSAQFTYYELRPELNAYACPVCHTVAVD